MVRVDDVRYWVNTKGVGHVVAAAETIDGTLSFRGAMTGCGTFIMGGVLDAKTPKRKCRKCIAALAKEASK